LPTSRQVSHLVATTFSGGVHSGRVGEQQGPDGEMQLCPLALCAGKSGSDVRLVLLLLLAKQGDANVNN